ncbi:hypothetical protein [Desertibaculum subflavum]|uniref:hypothetical protein n=1 Tax=Desertibaculum subflavum TaxID=2268458 RepID=UPI0013C4B0EA
MITGIAFLFVCLGIGYVGYWMVINDRSDPDGAHKGMLATPRPKPVPTRDSRDPLRR